MIDQPLQSNGRVIVNQSALRDLLSLLILTPIWAKKLQVQIKKSPLIWAFQRLDLFSFQRPLKGYQLPLIAFCPLISNYLG